MPAELTTQGVTLAPAGHDEAMAAKSDANDAAAAATAGTAQSAPAAPVRPENVPEKFWDAATGTVNTEALLKSYTELEKGKPTAATEPPAEQPPVSGEAAKDAVGAEAFDKFTAEFSEKGNLSDESYAELAAKGIPKDMVDSYISGQLALQSSAEAQGYALAGGKDQYVTMCQWASTNMTASEIDAFDQAVTKGDANMNQAILGLKARYEAAYGGDQSGMAKGGHANSATGYQSEAEMTRDMKDPRYKADPAYRRTVEQRLEATTAF